ncbi:MAG: molybdate ABC transporter permease subunit [Chthoniobacterales bacterium]
MNWEALFLTARLAACTAVLLVVIGLPLAWWLARTRWSGRIYLEAVVALPLVLPPTVLGFYMLLFFGPQGAPGRWIGTVFGTHLPFTFAGLLVASIIYSLPFAVQPFIAAFRFVDQELIDAARVDGATSWQAFWRITIPLAWPGLLAGFVLSFSHTVGEFGVALMIGGNIAGKTRTISMAIYDQVQSLDYGNAARTSLALLAFSFIVLTITYALQRNSGWQFFARPGRR